MKYINRILKKNKGLIVSYLLTGLTVSFLDNYAASYFQNIIDGLAERNLTAVTLSVYGVVLVLNYILSYLEEYPGNALDHNLYLDFKIFALEKIGKIQYCVYQTLGTGKLVQRIENGALAGKSMIFDFYFRVIRELIPKIIFSVFFVWQINHFITYCLLFGYVIVFLITNLLLKVLYKWKERILVHEEELNHFLVRGIMELVIFRFSRQYPGEIKKAECAKNVIVDSKVKIKLIHESFFTIFALLIAVLEIGVIIYVWKTNTITIGALVALIALIDHAYTPIAIFNVIFVQYKLDRASYYRFVEFLDSPDDDQIAYGRKADSLAGNIRIQNLEFSYGERKVLKNINLSIYAGEKVAFVGESGCGKSTLIKLITGLIKYDRGDIFIDDQQLSEIMLDSMYKSISYISQEASVFEGTLKENIVFDTEVSEEVIENVLSKAGLSEFYDRLPNGMQTVLGERGTLLSGGEKQRIAMARLWFHGGNLIVLDEATSAMDNLTEENILKNLLTDLSGKTIISIAHRLTSIKNFDRIVVFRDGEMIGQGTFAELMSENKYFQELYNVSRNN